MKTNKEDNQAYASFIENEEYLPYLKKLEDEVKEDMDKPLNSIVSFIPGLFLLAGYTKLDKKFFAVLQLFLFHCVDRCCELNDSHKTEIELWKLMRFIHYLKDLHLEVEGEPLDLKLGGFVMNFLATYFWDDYCADHKGEEKTE